MPAFRYFPPNILTASRLLLTMFSFAALYERDLNAAALWIVAAIIIDMFDGYLAVALDAKSAFGMEFDTQIDVINFGVTPAMLLYAWQYHSLDAAGVFLSFIPAIMATLRASIYAIQTQNSTTFRGLVTPGGAIIFTGMFFWEMNELTVTVITLLTCFLMVSRIHYLRIKGVMIIITTALFIFSALFFQKGLLMIGLAYALHGPIYNLFFHEKTA